MLQSRTIFFFVSAKAHHANKQYSLGYLFHCNFSSQIITTSTSNYNLEMFNPLQYIYFMLTIFTILIEETIESGLHRICSSMLSLSLFLSFSSLLSAALPFRIFMEKRLFHRILPVFSVFVMQYQTFLLEGAVEPCVRKAEENLVFSVHFRYRW